VPARSAASSISLDDAIATAATGDLWLFRGRSGADRAIQTLTNSPVNHVGMVVAIDDLPPLMWHAELGASLVDVWTGQHHRGVQLHHLRDAVDRWRNVYGQRAWLRQLSGEITRAHEDRLMEAIGRYNGRAFPKPATLLRQFARSRISPQQPRARETAFCAEVVAATYQHMGLLAKDHDPSWYDPGTFWSGDGTQLVPPFDLGAEIVVN
jgi:hypothetical protein